MRSCLIACVCLSLLSGCGALGLGDLKTQASYVPHPVEAKSIDFDENDQNAGILEADKNGVYVTDGWFRGYDAVAARYGKAAGTSPGDRTGVIKKTICPSGKYKGRACTLITYEMSQRKTDMKDFARDDSP